MVLRVLEATDPHAGHGHDEPAVGNTSDMTGIKLAIMGAVFVSACFVFFPYHPKLKASMDGDS